MIIIHETFVCKPGNASKLAKMFKETMGGYPNVLNILTDMTGAFNKVIMVSQYENLTDYEKKMAEWMKPTDENRRMMEKMKDYHEMFQTGSREIYKVW